MSSFPFSHDALSKEVRSPKKKGKAAKCADEETGINSVKP